MIKFGNGIDVKDIRFAKKRGGNLNISLIGSDDSVTIEGFFVMPNQRVENITLDNGKSLSANHIDNVVKAMFAHSANEFNFNETQNFWVGGL